MSRNRDITFPRDTETIESAVLESERQGTGTHLQVKTFMTKSNSKNSTIAYQHVRSNTQEKRKPQTKNNFITDINK
jgi:hypothetical protein